MISHVDPEVVTEIISKLSKRYGDMMPLTVNHGKIHEYLGMKFDFSTSNKVKINMYQYADRVIEGAPDLYKISS